MNALNNEHTPFLEAALIEAQKAADIDEVPIGAVVVEDGIIIGRGHNYKEAHNDVTAHAEIMAIKDAAQTIGDWRLTHCTLYSTLEPCPMCFGAILHARLDAVVYGAKDFKWGACESHLNLPSITTFNHKTSAEYLSFEPGKTILTQFFKQKRLK